MVRNFQWQVLSSIELLLTFNKDLDPITAGDKRNYWVDGLEIRNVKMVGPKQVKLTTSMMVPHARYNLEVKGVKDITGNAV